MLSGYSLHATGLELDAIAAVVIGGTLLSGGVGQVPGTFFGVLVLGLIQTLIVFDGTLSSWWTRIVIGILLLMFCLLQRLLVGHSAAR
jgi:simple sugar transport system permease protein